MAPEDRGKSFLAALAGLAYTLLLVLGASSPLHAGKALAEFERWTAGGTSPDLNGAHVALSGVHQPLILVHLFATKCELCGHELLQLDRFAAHGNGPATVLAEASENSSFSSEFKPEIRCKGA
jgi:hypothetical protein